jgi:beta-glucosidase
MIRTLAAFYTVFAISFAVGTGQTTTGNRDAVVEEMLKKMTAEEKVGQMTQVTNEVVLKSARGPADRQELDPAKLEDAVVRHHVGSIINVGGTGGYTVDQWQAMLKQIQDVAIQKTRLKIPVLYGIDAVHGANYTTGATIFPQSIAQAAAWNPEMVEEIGRVTALEVRASGIPWNFCPVLDVGRQPLWPRLWETFGEDPVLATTLGTRLIKGLQGDNYGAEDKIASCLKHFAGYGMPLNGKDRTPAWIDERMMREIFLPPFEAAVKAGSPTVMANSAEINGIPGHANYHLLTEVLKGEMRFKGFVVSDWEDIKRLYTRDRVADSPKEAVRLAVMAGIDMSMVPMDFSFSDLLVELVKEDRVPMARIDDAVRRILTVKADLGLFDRPYPSAAMKAKFATKENTEINLRSAQEVITLLKNDGGILPLKKSTKVLVAGPTANMLSVLNSGWTITWQGDTEGLYPKDKPTILAAVEAKVGKQNVRYVQGTSFDAPLDIAGAASAAKEADAVVLCLGEKAYCEMPGNIDDLTLDEAQLQLAEAVAGAGKPVVLVLAEGRPRVISKIAERIPAILLAFLPGMEGGRAIADVLFGDVNPSGKLPITYPRHPNGLFTYDMKPLETHQDLKYMCQWPFGFGLSYTTFEYRDLTLDRETMKKSDRLEVAVTVKNTGSRAGKEVVQVYITDLYGSVSRPIRQLKKFDKIKLDPGQEHVVKFSLTADDLSFIGLQNTRIVEAGEFRVTVANLTKGFTLE